MCCGGSQGRMPGKSGSGLMQESAEHVPPEVLWSLSGSISLTNPWARLPSVPYPVNSGPDTTMTTCTERPDHHCATVEYTNKQCRHTQVCSLPLRRLIKPTQLSHTIGFQCKQLPLGFGWRIWQKICAHLSPHMYVVW